MKKRTNLKRWMMAMSGFIMALLGFSSCSNNDDDPDAVMYGQPYSKFELKGKVTDTEGAPVENALITIKQKFKNGDIAGQYREVYSVDPTSSKEDRRVYTYANGKYQLEASPVMSEIRVICVPQDSTLSADSTEIKVVYTPIKGEDKGWCIGTYEGEVNFTLKRK